MTEGGGPLRPSCQAKRATFRGRDVFDVASRRGTNLAEPIRARLVMENHPGYISRIVDHPSLVKSIHFRVDILWNMVNLEASLRISTLLVWLKPHKPPGSLELGAAAGPLCTLPAGPLQAETGQPKQPKVAWTHAGCMNCSECAEGP